MFASIAFIQSSRPQSRKLPGGGPPALVTTMSKSLRCAKTFARHRAVAADVGSGGFEVGGRARHDHDVHSFTRECLCATETQTFACAAYQRPFALDAQIHDACPKGMNRE
jgi:hypothetical protein